MIASSRISGFSNCKYSKGKGPYAWQFKHYKLQYGPYVLAEAGGPKVSVSKLIKNQSWQVFELTANECC